MGILPQDAERIVQVSQSPEYLRERQGLAQAYPPGGLLTLNPDVSNVVKIISTVARKPPGSL